MKKALFLLCATALLAACEPTTTTTTTASDSTKVDSAAVVQDTVKPSDTTGTNTGEVVEVTPATTDDKKVEEPTTGRQANPNIDLNAKRFKVTGHVLVVSPYCGGAAPSQEILDKAKTPQPAVNQPFVIRNGSINKPGSAIVTRARTDANGDFSMDLTPGTYCMVIAEKESPRTTEFLNTQYYVIDKKCDDKWLAGCDFTFTVKDKPVSGLRLTLNRKCMINSFSPCISWDGPLPPAAAPRGGR